MNIGHLQHFISSESYYGKYKLRNLEIKTHRKGDPLPWPAQDSLSMTTTQVPFHSENISQLGQHVFSVAQSRPTLCDPMDCGLPGFCVHEISQARILEWVAIPFSRVSSQSMDQTHISCVSCIGRWILYH